MVIQAVFGFSMLEAELSGALRAAASARGERPIRAMCAAPQLEFDHLVTNLFLYHLQRHSDHHANPTRRYQTLRSMDGAPELPSGYAT